MRLGSVLALCLLAIPSSALADGFRWKIGPKEVARYHHLFDFEVDDGGPEVTAPKVLLLRRDHFRQGRYRAKTAGIGGLILEQLLSFPRMEKDARRLAIEERYTKGGWRLRLSGIVEARVRAQKVEVEGQLSIESEAGSRYQISDAELSWTSVFNPKSSALQAAEYEFSGQASLPNGQRGHIEGSGGIAFVFLGSAAMHRKLAPRFDARFKRGRARDTARDIGKNSEDDEDLDEDPEDDEEEPEDEAKPGPRPDPMDPGEDEDGGFDGGLDGDPMGGKKERARDPLPQGPRLAPRPKDPGPKGMTPKKERALARKINRAIARAAAFLSGGGNPGGNNGLTPIPLGGSLNSAGELTSYALAHAGRGYGGDPGVIGTSEGKAVYITALRILTITAGAAVPEASDRPLRPHYRLEPLGASLRSALQSQVNTLLAMRQADTGIWGYKSGPSPWDNSNTQFAVQALYVARRCGARIKPEVWKGIFQHFARSQRKQGRQRAIAVVMPPDQSLLRDEENGPQELVERVTWRRPAGWRYNGLQRYPISGSMTTGGLMSLTLAYRALKEDGELPSSWETRFRTKRDQALAWIGQNLKFKTNPRDGRWHFYYLFGLEKAMDALGVKTIAGKDWYVEGARYLLASQAEDGGWSPAPEANEQGLLDRSHVTAFSLLFLSRAFLPFGARQPTGGVRPPRPKSGPEGSTTPRSLADPQDRESRLEPAPLQPRK